MVLVPVGEVDISVTQSGTEQDSFTASDATTVELFDYITNHGSGNINGPNDDLSGSGYYSSISNNISDRGTANISSPGDIPTNSGYYSGFNNNITNHGTGYIDGPSDTLSGGGYYSGIQNNIADRGSLGNVTPGNDEPAGYYSSGIIPKPSYNTTIQVNGSNQGSFTQSSNSTYNVDVSSSVSNIDISNEVYPSYFNGSNTYTVYDGSKSSADITKFVINGSIVIRNKANIDRGYDYTLSLGGTVLISESGTQFENSNHSVSISDTISAPTNSTLTLDASSSNYYIRHDVGVDITTTYEPNSTISVNGVTK